MKQTLILLGCTLLVLLIMGFMAPVTEHAVSALTQTWPTPTAVPLPPGLQPTPTSNDEPSDQPNLIVESIETIPVNPFVNVTCTIKVTIKNESAVPLGFANNFYTDLYVNPQSTNLSGKRGDVFWGVQGFYMGAGQSYVMTTTWVFTDVVAQNLWAQVDTPTPPDFPRGDVIERNEDDNILGPTYVRVMTNQRFTQQDHVDFMQGQFNTLDLIPLVGTVGITCPTPGLTITGDSALALGLFEEPPYSWGVSANTDDYNAKWPDRLLNSGAIVLVTAVQADGKVLVGGQFTLVDDTTHNRIARLNPDGSLDPGFATGSGANGPVRAIALQSDGKIIIGGSFTQFNGSTRNCLARLNPDGSLDPTFNPGAGGPVYTLVVQTDDKILVGGNFTAVGGISRNRIARLNDDGSVDTGFDPGTGADNVVYALAVREADNTVILGGNFTHVNALTRTRIARLTSTGTVDLTFDPGDGANSPVYAVAIQSDGKLIFGGDFTTIDGAIRNRIARLNTDGTVDAGFNPGLGANALVRALDIQTDNRVLIGGHFTRINGVARNHIARINTDGSLDATFDTSVGTNGDVWSITLQTDGRGIIAGEFASVNGTGRNCLARLNDNGTLDGSFAPQVGSNDWATANNQTDPIIAASGDYLVAVWQDGRDAPIYGTQIYMTWSDDKGATWYTPTIRVNDDITLTGVLHEHPNVAVAENGDVVVVWQDRRSGKSFDIYVQQYQFSGIPTTLSPIGINRRVDNDAGNYDQIYPDIAVDKAGSFYIAWQDQRNGNDDIFAVRSEGSGLALQWDDDTLISDEPTRSKQSNPSIDVITAIKVQIEVIECVPEDPPIIIYEVYTREQPVIVVAWEDWRNGNSDIYIVRSEDEGETYGLDTRVNQDPLYTQFGHFDPAIAVTMGTTEVTVRDYDPVCGEIDVDAVIPIAYVHVVWQDYRRSTVFYPSGMGNDPDIYYAQFVYRPSYEDMNVYTFEPVSEEQVNHNDVRDWQNGNPVWQGYPEIDGWSDKVQDEWRYDVFIVWADGRNYGGEENNYDVYLDARIQCCDRMPDYLGNNILVNDGVKLHNFDPAQDPSYRVDSPPPARQIRPSVVNTARVQMSPATCPELAGCPFFEDYIFVVWDDDRIQDPFVNRDVYFARSNLLFINHTPAGPFAPPPGAPGRDYYYGTGTYVSAILDTKNYSSTWYIVDWHACTADGTYLTLQTRLGDTISEVLSSDWYPNRNVPNPGHWPYPDVTGLSIGAPLEGYDAPGQHILGADGQPLPEARYIQYKVNMWAKGYCGPDDYPNYAPVKTPMLFDVILHYNVPNIIYLPIVLRNY
ncbi:MAG: hypothetical protein KKB13_13725 [Chloroflexi bacterium]|nr:hypothetical protein [Chloroflexota bacterium]